MRGGIMRLRRTFFCFPVYLGILFSASCSTPEAPVSSEPAPCSEQARHCSNEDEIEVCRDGQWRGEADCPFPALCLSEPGGPVCREPEISSGPSVPPLPESLAISEMKAEISAFAASPVCRLFQALYRRAEEKLAKEENPEIERPRRVGVSENDRKILLRCAWSRWLDDAAGWASLDPMLAPLPSAPAMLEEVFEDIDYRLVFQDNPEQTASESLLPALSLELELTTGSTPRIAPDSLVMKALLPDLRIRAFARFRSASSPLLGLVRPRLDLSVKRLKYALSGFFYQPSFRSASQTCSDPNVHFATGRFFPKLAGRKELYACVDSCRTHLQNAEPALRRIARREPSADVAAMLSDAEIRDFSDAKPGLVCLAAADYLSHSGLLPVPMEPDHLPGLESLFAVWRKAMTPEEYVGTLWDLASAAPEEFPAVWGGFAWADALALRGLAEKRLENTIDAGLLRLLPFWLRQDRERGVPLLIGQFPKYRDRPDAARAVLDLIGRFGTPSAIPFLLDRLREGEVPASVVAYLLMVPDGTEKAQTLLLSKPRPLPSETARTMLAFLARFIGKPADEQPRRLLPLAQNLVERSPDFHVLFQSREILKKYESPSWNWPPRPSAVDNYANLFPGSTEEAAWLEAARTALGEPDEDALFGLYDYALSLEESKRFRMERLFGGLSAPSDRLRKVSRRVAACTETPEAAGLARRLAETLSTRP